MDKRITWTEEKVREAAKTCSTRSELAKRFSAAHKFARLTPGLLDELYGPRKLPWTREELVNEAAKYATKFEFQRKAAGAYVTCMAKFPGLIDELFDNQLRYWRTEADVLGEMRKYSTRTELQKASGNCYAAASKKFPHLFDEVYGPSLVERHTPESVLALAAKCENRVEFMRRFGGAYQYAMKNMDVDAIFPRRRERWDSEEKVRTEAAKYRTRGEFHDKAQRAYELARELGIMNDLGFDPPNFGFKEMQSAYLYVTDIFLTDCRPGLMIGISNKHPKYRYRVAERVLLTNRVAFLFDHGYEAAHVERHLKAKFFPFTVEPIDSPLIKKTGARGEILRGVKRDDLITDITAFGLHREEIRWD